MRDIENVELFINDFDGGDHISETLKFIIKITGPPLTI